MPGISVASAATIAEVETRVLSTAAREDDPLSVGREREGLQVGPLEGGGRPQPLGGRDAHVEAHGVDGERRASAQRERPRGGGERGRNRPGKKDREKLLAPSRATRPFRACDCGGGPRGISFEGESARGARPRRRSPPRESIRASPMSRRARLPRPAGDTFEGLFTSRNRRSKRAPVRVFHQDRRQRVAHGLPLERALAREHLHSTHPNAEMSVRLSTGLPRACSGDMYAAVPRITPAAVPRAVSVGEFEIEGVEEPLASLSKIFARPKSRSLTRPSGVTLMFAGLRSRRTLPFSCVDPAPRRSDGLRKRDSSSGRGPKRFSAQGLHLRPSSMTRR